MSYCATDLVLWQATGSFNGHFKYFILSKTEYVNVALTLLASFFNLTDLFSIVT